MGFNSAFKGLITGVEVMSAVLYLLMYRCSAAVDVTFCFIYLLESITELDAMPLIPSIKTPLMNLGFKCQLLIRAAGYLCALATSRRAAISFVISFFLCVPPSVRPHGTIWLQLEKFSLNFLLLNIFFFENASRKV
jgi:hypothetical protein